MPLVALTLFPFHQRAVSYALPVLPRRVSPLNTALLFRRGERFPRWSDPAPEPVAPTEPPLTPTERALYIGFACWVALTFVALFWLVIFLHSAGNAN